MTCFAYVVGRRRLAIERGWGPDVHFQAIWDGLDADVDLDVAVDMDLYMSGYDERVRIFGYCVRKR